MNNLILISQRTKFIDFLFITSEVFFNIKFLLFLHFTKNIQTFYIVIALFIIQVIQSTYPHNKSDHLTIHTFNLLRSIKSKNINKLSVTGGNISLNQSDSSHQITFMPFSIKFNIKFVNSRHICK